MSFPTGFIARGGFFQPHEASRLQSFREPQSVYRAWAHAAPRYRQSDNFTNQIATLRRQVNGAQQPRLNYSGMHPFKIYNFPRNMRYFLNNDDWRRIKVRTGFVRYSNGFNEGNIAPVWGTDFIGRGVANDNLEDDVFLGTGDQIPPTDSSSITGSWNEIIVPVENQITIWVSLEYAYAPTIAWANSSDLAASFTATSLLDGNTFTEHWQYAPFDDPFHQIIGKAYASNGQLTIQQFQTSNIILPYYTNTNVADTSGGPMTYRGLYSDGDYYFPGNVVKVEDGDFINLYIFSPSTVDGYGWAYSQGPITGVDPGSDLVANAPWITLSRTPKGKWQMVGGINTFVHT